MFYIVLILSFFKRSFFNLVAFFWADICFSHLFSFLLTHVEAMYSLSPPEVNL